jgi:hypothetical protein
LGNATVGNRDGLALLGSVWTVGTARAGGLGGHADAVHRHMGDLVLPSSGLARSAHLGEVLVVQRLVRSMTRRAFAALVELGIASYRCDVWAIAAAMPYRAADDLRRAPVDLASRCRRPGCGRGDHHAGSTLDSAAHATSASGHGRARVLRCPRREHARGVLGAPRVVARIVAGTRAPGIGTWA